MEIKRECDNYILVSSSKTTELLKRLIKKAEKAFPKVNALKLADYSTKFKDIR